MLGIGSFVCWRYRLPVNAIDDLYSKSFGEPDRLPRVFVNLLLQRLFHRHNLFRKQPSVSVEISRRPQILVFVFWLDPDRVPDELQLALASGGSSDCRWTPILLRFLNQLLQRVEIPVII